MNIEYDFKLFDNKIIMERRMRSYEVKFNFPSFRTKESEDASETNSGILKITYSPQDKLLEFHSLQDYVKKYREIPISLECAAWSILDDIFDKVQPCYAVVNITSELPDCATTNIIAQRGWKKNGDQTRATQIMEETV